jgi:MFS family permease
MKAISWVIPFIPVFWLFSSNIGYLMTVQFISGISWAAFDLCNQTHICSASPEDKRLHYIVYQRCVITIASAIGPLLGAFLVNYMFPVYGSQILGIFLLSGIMRMLVVVTMSHKLKTEDSPGTGERSPMGTFTIYQAEYNKPSTSINGYPRFMRKETEIIPLVKRTVRSRELVHSLSGSKSVVNSIERIEIQPLQNGSPFRQALYAARRQDAADMLGNKTRPVKSISNIHRLTLAIKN